MFWSETGDEAQIECAGMDGADRRVLIKRSLRWPVSLTVDSLRNRIYWTDEKLKCIGSANLDGGDIKVEVFIFFQCIYFFIAHALLHNLVQAVEKNSI